jgi:hypothetical protein
MHKKIEADLVSLAHSILEMKNNNDVVDLHKKAQLIYEKLCVLKFVDANINGILAEEKVENETNLADDLAEEIVVEIKEDIVITEEEVVEEEFVANEVTLEKEIEIDVELDLENTTTVETKKGEEIFEEDKSSKTNEENESEKLQFSLEDEFKDAISADIATSLFERATIENPVIKENPAPKQKSLNDAVFSKNLQVGLNDRIGFVKHLFDGSQEDFNRVLSQLNTFNNQEEAFTFVLEIVKPDYNWTDKQDYEERFLKLIERKFL